MASIRLLSILLIFSLPLPRMAGEVSVAPAPFRDGDRWCVLGDSITRSGQYHKYIELFYLTRYPDRALEVINCGISGDTAKGGLQRLAWDCLAAKPTVVSIMLGMNDVQPGLYDPQNPATDLDDRRARCAQVYDQSMRQLTKHIIDFGARVILLTPSPYDDSAELAQKNYLGCGQALEGFAKRVEAIAQDQGVPVVDFHGLMKMINVAHQLKKPQFTIVGGDRIHPTPPGHLVMSYAFLKAQGLSGPVSRITLNADTRQPDSPQNCAIEDIQGGRNGISFICRESALPFPVEPVAKPGLDLVPFTSEFNEQIIRVSGLSPGDYELRIDGQFIRSYSAVQLAKGVDLSSESSTPQMQQSMRVQAAIQKKWKIEAILRTLAVCEHTAWPEAQHPVDQRQMAIKLDARLARSGGNRSVLKDHKEYVEFKPQEESLRRDLKEAIHAARAAAQPIAHKFSIQPVAAGKNSPPTPNP
jgi:lysophospholipase L1-like esterase